MSAGADQGEGVVVVDGVKEEPVGCDMQFTVCLLYTSDAADE